MPRGLAWISLVALLMSGCEVVPKTGPTSEAIRTAADEPQSTIVPFAFAPVSPETLGVLEARLAAPARDINTGRPVSGPQLAVGDAVTVTIWEAVEGGLFSGQGGGSSLPSQRIGPSGTIIVPYAGKVRAAGRTPDAVADAVVSALAGKAIEPQVLVTVDASPRSSVTVIGDAATKSGRVALQGVGERVLDVVAASGGASVPAHRTLVRLTRGDAVGETHLSRILREPGQNVRVRSGDVITLQDSQRSYTVLGASNQPSRVPFSTEIVTLDQAIAETGGLLDNRSDPGSVFVFRYEQSEVVSTITGEPQSEPVAPIVYNLDLRNPGAFFLASRFEMADRDIVYVANAELADAQKILVTIATALSPAVSAVRLGNSF